MTTSIRTVNARRHLALAALLFATVAVMRSSEARAESWSPDTIALPEIPKKAFNILDNGAKGDGTTINTQAIQKTIDKAAQSGGGIVIVPGGKFVSGPITLHSKIDLHLNEDAVLVMSANREDFPMREDNRGRLSFITAQDSNDVQVSGKGMIYGLGESWWPDALRAKAGEISNFHRPQMLAFNNCDRVRLTEFTTKNPPNLHCGMNGCSDVTIDGITMDAPDDSPHTDALNLKVRRTLIQNSYISTGDDNIVFVGSDRPKGWDVVAEDIVIRNCKFGYGHGLSIGSYTAGGIRNILVENVSFKDTTSGIRFKSARGRGGVVENIVFKNITLEDVRWPISIGSYYPKLPKRPDEETGDPSVEPKPVYRNIVIENVKSTNSQESITLWGLPEEPITNVSIKNVAIDCEIGARLFHCKEVNLADVKISTSTGDPLITFDADVKGLEGRAWTEDDAPKK